MKFDIDPYRGALPILFGMSRDEVRHLLGTPGASARESAGHGMFDYYSEFNVGYDDSHLVNHVGLGPIGAELMIQGRPIWDGIHPSDPNPILLALDPNPLESAGIWLFLKLGVTSSGFHDDDDGQRAVTAFSRTALIALTASDIVRLHPADTSKYTRQPM